MFCISIHYRKYVFKHYNVQFIFAIIWELMAKTVQIVPEANSVYTNQLFAVEIFDLDFANWIPVHWIPGEDSD